MNEVVPLRESCIWEAKDEVEKIAVDDIFNGLKNSNKQEQNKASGVHETEV